MSIRKTITLVGITVGGCLLLQGCETMNGISRDLGSMSSYSADRSYSSTSNNSLFFWGDNEPRRQHTSSSNRSRGQSSPSHTGSNHSEESYSIGNYNVGGGDEPPIGVPAAVGNDVGQATQKAGEATSKSIQELPKGL